MSTVWVALALMILMALAGLLILVTALRERRAADPGTPRRTAATLRALAGGVILGGVLAGLGGAFLPMQYAIVALPFLGLTAAVVLGLPLLVASAIVSARDGRRPR
ncbi:hypothetical protein [Litorihabitans aurantiacus]|uniref:Uncharacterized protein n=1 Tax=Litorihabitans aurantiacus TaxID=1930061 RepID=A0AA37XH26_9MICO|nr:hypothetical protein [Litorihabitans aurantiacus]GMA32958.1 hypothetical protein GCM10025875_29500 [Litorihabitans aurantiacus]